jgi:hypothetical protein
MIDQAEESFPRYSQHVSPHFTTSTIKITISESQYFVENQIDDAINALVASCTVHQYNDAVLGLRHRFLHTSEPLKENDLECCRSNYSILKMDDSKQGIHALNWTVEQSQCVYLFVLKAEPAPLPKEAPSRGSLAPPS